MRADQPERLSGRVALDGGFDRNPARLTVAGADDPVSHRVVADIVCDRVAEFLFGGLAILGVNAPDPVLVGFVGSIRPQSMDLQIFRRPAIAETSREIDFKPAAPADL